MNLSHIPLLFRTVRHLQFSQVAARGLRQLPWRKSKAHAAGTPTSVDLDDSFPCFRNVSQNQSPDDKLLSQLESGFLPILNQSLPVGTHSIQWYLGTVSRQRLETITLHYHQWLFELAQLCAKGGHPGERAACLFEQYLTDWLDCCQLHNPGAEALAWNSYAIATRLGWSIRAYQLLRSGKHPVSQLLLERWLQSLWHQGSYLHANLEWDLRANHLLRDAVGLAWAGRFFSDNTAKRWLRTATKLAVEQIEEQFLSDGGHFERSPFYHLEVMDDCVWLALLLSDQSVSEKLRAVWERAAEFAAWMRHPDGTVPQFNDGAAIEVAPHMRFGRQIGMTSDLSPRHGVRHFSDSGIIACHKIPWSIFFDVGAIGPDYQPGHAHADTLSIECSYQGERLFVDPGCYGYDNDDRRLYDRSTMSHNTLSIDGQNSSEVWHIFRVGRRARPIDVLVNNWANRTICRAGHNGFGHLPGKPIHSRQIEVHCSGLFQITDEVTGRGEHTVEGGFLLSPDWHAELQNGGWILLKDGIARLKIDIHSLSPLKLSTELRPVHPHYHVEEQTQRLTWSVVAQLPLTVKISIEPIPVSRCSPRTDVDKPDDPLFRLNSAGEDH